MRRLFPLLLALPLLFMGPTPRSHAAAPSCAAIGSALAAAQPPIAGGTLVASASAAPSAGASTTYVVQPGDTLSAIARRHGVSVRSLLQANALRDPNRITSGQRLTIPMAVPAPAGVQPLAPPLTTLWRDGEARQGEVLPLWLSAPQGTRVTGYLNDRLGEQVIPFRPYCGLLWGLVAFDALWDAPGPYVLTLKATSAAGVTTTSRVTLSLQGVAYWEGPAIQYPPDKQALLDPAVLKAENDALTAQFSALGGNPPQWSGYFVRPTSTVITGSFGARGIVNGRYSGYHEGIDLRGPVGTPIYAAAPGTALIAGPLTVRGNTVYLDHGGGVVTGYFHMSQIAIRPGEVVTAGQWIGNVGGSGLTTGPHLHWELRVNGRWVNPAPWMSRYYP